MSLVPVIISAPSGFVPLHLITAVRGDREVRTLTSSEWEASHLRRATRPYKRFVFLKESTAILDPEGFWDAIDGVKGPSWLFAYPSCYMAIYDSKSLLDALDAMPAPMSKEDSITMENGLQRALPYPILWPEISDENAKRVDMIDGKPELIIGNDLVEKAKGTARCGKPGDKRDGVCSHYLKRFGL